MKPSLWKIFVSTVLGLTGFVTSGVAAAEDTDQRTPEHLELALYLAENVDPDHNEFATKPNYLKIPGIHEGVQTVQSRNKCATFITNVLKIAYEKSRGDIRRWSGSTSPYAYMYYDMVLEEKGFDKRWNADQIEPGDLHFLMYSRNPEAPATGHSMIVATKPAQVEGTERYCFEVVHVTHGGIARKKRCIKTYNGIIVDERGVFGKLTQFD